MSQPPPSLVGLVVERSPSSNSSFKTTSSSSASGFPSVQHRSKSAFARAREARRNGTQDTETRKEREAPIVHRSGYLLSDSRAREEEDLVPNDAFSVPSNASSSNNPAEEQWKVQMRRDNDHVIEAMSEEERERHSAEIFEQLGPNVGELLRKAREARAGAVAGLDTHKEEPDEGGSRSREWRGDSEMHENGNGSDSKAKIQQLAASLPHTQTKLASPPRSILVSNTPPISRSSSPGRLSRKLRFADVTPKDVHVFQSEPPSPRRPLGLLLPPPPEQGSSGDDVNVVSRPNAEEGTPEDIRRRFFPHLPARDPTLEWIESDDPAPDTEPRFDLSGSLIPLAERDSLPTHLGLHHHGGSTAAGYTLADLLLLARSSVPAQRATVLGVLSKLVRRVSRQKHEVSELKDHDGVRSRALVVGLAALTEKGSVGVQAVELVWTCVVYWDEGEVGGLDGVELRPIIAKTSQGDKENQSDDSLPSTDPFSSFLVSSLLPQIALLLETQSLPPESLSQLLSILHRFARHSVEIATAISEAPQLIAHAINTFLLTPIPPTENGTLPNPHALDLLYTLALSSRANARTLEGPADALLRFITSAAPLPVSHFPCPLADALLCGTLDLYSALGKYGIYSGIATTAAEHFGRLSSRILRASEDVAIELKISWLHLLSVWMVCARDPHRTTPTHDLLWSQVAGWTWGEDLLEFRNNLLSGSLEHDTRLWGAVWGALATWLEGCRVNCAKAGQGERDAVSAALDRTWSTGVEREVVSKSVAQLRRELSELFSEEASILQRNGRFACVAELSQTLADFARLCLACLQRRTSESAEQGASEPDIPSWILDATSLLSPLASEILSYDTWRSVQRTSDNSPEDLYSRVRLLCLRSASTFLASFLKLSRVVSLSDEWFPLGITTLEMLLPGDEESAQWLVEEIINKGCTQIECAGKLPFLIPFFKNMIRPDDALYLSPLSATPDSIQLSTTQCLPADCAPGKSTRRALFGLPLSRDWPCIALDHLLRSGTSPILTNPDSVPDSWNASETDLVQASLSLMHYVQSRLNTSGLQYFAPSFEHVVFACMKVFMLEHNQHQSNSNEEVFRDAIVGRLMDALLRPFTLGETLSTCGAESLSLETVAREFLGTGTPFFQFYTDFVALYDAISFSHSTFGRLLLPPTSMTYAADYRKLLWGDFGHTLRTIRTPINDVPALGLKQYLWPLEADAEMLGWYLRALVKWQLVGFVRFIAVHHIACNIWSDLQDNGEVGLARERRARTLLIATFNQAASGAVKDVVRYVQGRDADLWLPPTCYRCGAETKLARLAFVRGLGETQIAENMERIFLEED